MSTSLHCVIPAMLFSLVFIHEVRIHFICGDLSIDEKYHNILPTSHTKV